MENKQPITARIAPDLARELKARTDQGENKTSIIEAALRAYLKRDTRADGEVSQETIELIRDVIRQEIGEALGPLKDVIQGERCSRARDTNVIQGGDPESRKIAEAQAVVWKVQKFIEAGHGVKEACRLAGCSDKKYYNKLKILKGHSSG